MSYKDYISIARPDHWFKHIFVIPGIILAYVMVPNSSFDFYRIIIGSLSVCLISSANYVINELLDAPFDQYHPIKKYRPIASNKISKRYVSIEYTVLLLLGLFLASLIGRIYLLYSIVFSFCAILYNVEPLRLKDQAYLDVILESFNNPIRLLLGWTMISTNTIPPYSIIIAYWFGGAFLMSSKRLAEYLQLKQEDLLEDLINYRKSFNIYTEKSLLLSAYFFSLISIFNMAVFLVKYKIELILIIPIISILFTYYLGLSYNQLSIVQTPEKLYRDKLLLLIIILLIAGFYLLLNTDLQFLDILTQPYITKIS